jgi:4-amino-4-deoxy-L-arabinose transferase-like glycosyltransferase
MQIVNSKDGALERMLLPLSLVATVIFVAVGTGRSIWLDEANSILIASQNIHGLIDRLRGENNLPAYYLILRLWIGVFGDSEIASRLLSGLFYVATIAVVFCAGRLPGDRTRNGLYSAFFFLISSQAIHQAQNVRMYSMLGLLSALSVFFFLRMTLRSRSNGADFVAIAVVNAIGSFTHMWFFFLIGAEALASLLFVERRLRVLTPVAVSIVPFLLLWLPALGDQLRNGATDWMVPFHWVFILDVLIRYYGGTEFGLVGSAAFYGACVVLMNRMGRKAFSDWISDSRTRILATCFVGSIAAALAVCVVKPIYFPDRYTIVALPALSLLLGDALARFAPRFPLTLFCFALLALQTGMRIYARNESTDVPSGLSDRRTAEFIAKNVPPGDVLAFTSLSRLAVDYYLERFGCGSCYRETSFPSEIDRHPSWRYLTYDAQRLEAQAAEARDLVKTWEESGTKSIWLLYGADPEISRTLREEIERHYKLQQEIPLGGPYHDSILRYRPSVAAEAK